MSRLNIIPRPLLRGAASACGGATIRRFVIALLWMWLAPLAAFAVEPDEVLPDAALEARARTISEGLRCLVCQNQSIDDSHATLARDLRLLVRERLKAGDSDGQVEDYLVARYGDFVLLKPPFKAETVLLWGLPFLVLAIGGGALLAKVRSPAADDPGRSLSIAENAEITELLKANRADAVDFATGQPGRADADAISERNPIR